MRAKTILSRMFRAQRVVAGTLGEPPTRSRQVKMFPPLSDSRLILHGARRATVFSLHRLLHRILRLGATDRPIDFRAPILNHHLSVRGPRRAGTTLAKTSCRLVHQFISWIAIDSPGL